MRLLNGFKYSICDELAYRLERSSTPEGTTGEYYVEYGLWLIFKAVTEECGKSWGQPTFFALYLTESLASMMRVSLTKIPNVQLDMLNRDQRDCFGSITSAVVEGARSRNFLFMAQVVLERHFSIRCLCQWAKENDMNFLCYLFRNRCRLASF